MRRMIAGFLAVMLLVGSGCADKKSVPSGILPRDKMEVVLWDMIQADQFSALYLAKDSARIDLKMEQLRLYDQVFRLHQVSRDEFRKSFQYYQDHPDLNQMVYDSLLSRGNRQRAESYNRPVQQVKPILTTPPPATSVIPPVTPPAVKAPGTPAKAPGTPVTTPGKPGKNSLSPAARLQDSLARARRHVLFQKHSRAPGAKLPD